MLYAVITITISVDESKLTKAQQIQADKSDHLEAEHPLDDGVDNLRSTVENIAPQLFEYLGDGSKAIEIIVD